MRNRSWLLKLLIPALLAAAATAGSRHVHGSDDDLVWSEDGFSLAMHSNATSGVVVDSTDPTPFHGLRSGDVIVSIDNHPVAHLEEYLDAMRHHDKSQTTLVLRRAGHDVVLTLSASERIAMIPPPPPPAPAPPPPPPPPPPPHY